jgi:hypothetical protein
LEISISTERMKTLETTLSQLEPQAWAQDLKQILEVMSDPQSLEQFEISDERSALEIATYFE